MPVLDIDDDDSPLDARGMLKDGRTFRVRMHARDSVQAAIAADRRRVVDGAGNDGLALHKPGPRRLEGHGLKHWIEAAKKRLHRNVLAIALANKLARIAWSVLARGRAFEASKLQTA